MSQIIDEFDQPSPATVSFCHKISSEDFDLHSAQTTKDALHELMNHLEQRPDEFYQILRRRKAENLKMFQFLKVKVLNKFKDQYLEKYFPDDLCKEELDKMKKEMASAFDYAQDGKKTGVRFSKRLAEKHIQPPLSTSTPKKHASVPPPPPPPPPLPAMTVISSNDIISPVLSDARSKPSGDGAAAATPSGTFQHEVKLIQSIRGVQARRKLHDKSTTSEKYALKTSGNLKKPCLRSIEKVDIEAAKSSLKSRNTRSPRKENRKPYNEQDGFSMFNTKLLEKFKNARSPHNDDSPSGKITVNDSGFESP